MAKTTYCAFNIEDILFYEAVLEKVTLILAFICRLRFWYFLCNKCPNTF